MTQQYLKKNNFRTKTCIRNGAKKALSFLYTVTAMKERILQ